MKRDPKVLISKPAHPDERRDPGPTSNLVPDCSFNPAQGSAPFLDPDVRRDERVKRASFVVAAVASLALLPLTACGLTPVYGGQGESYATSGPIQISEIRAIASSGAASGRTGHFLRQELVRTVGQGVPGFSTGTLDVELRQNIERLAFAPDQAASRSDYVGTATWTLRAASGDVLGTGTVEERASFNFADAAYADMAAQTGAQERLATLLARSIRSDLIIAAGKTVNPKNGKPVDPAAPAPPK